MEAIKYYVRGAFQGVKVTPEVLEQQEELIADLTAKVDDLVAQGKSRDDALGAAIASMGDLSPLVAEFEPAEEAPGQVVAPSIYSAHLDLHVIAISASIGAAVMIASTALGAWTRLVTPGAGYTLLAVLAVGIWWVREAYLRYLEAPDSVRPRDLAYKARFRKALLVWASLAIGVTWLNIIAGANMYEADFWCWPIWVAGGTWALTVKVEEHLSKREEFQAPIPAISEAV